MPAMNGLEFLQEAQRIVPGVPVMLITAYPDLEIALEAINKAGVESFITKPFRTEEVIDQVRAALFKRRVDRLWKDSLAQSLGRGGARP
jgi:FixJ family two-component response regulator